MICVRCGAGQDWIRKGIAVQLHGGTVADQSVDVIIVGGAVIVGPGIGAGRTPVFRHDSYSRILSQAHGVFIGRVPGSVSVVVANDKVEPFIIVTYFHEYLELEADEREDCEPFIYTVDADRLLQKVRVSESIVQLAEERQRFWSQLRELAGVEVSGHLRDEVGANIMRKAQQESASLKAEYEAKFARLITQYPQLIARRMAEGLLRAGGNKTVAELLEEAEHWEGPAFQPPEGMDFGLDSGAATAEDMASPAADADGEDAEAAEEAPAAAGEEEDEDLVREPWIESIRCTACDDCINLNPKMFAYNEDGLAYIADASAGTFKELVTAAEKCAPLVIHPGDPLNPDEKGLDKLIPRAEKFN